jgi:hypothetical protein
VAQHRPIDEFLEHHLGNLPQISFLYGLEWDKINAVNHLAIGWYQNYWEPLKKYLT